jgi:hypothetical protein
MVPTSYLTNNPPPGAGGLSAQQILSKRLFFDTNNLMSLGVVTDGYVFPKAPAQVFAAGEENRVGLIIGNNARERCAWRRDSAAIWF